MCEMTPACSASRRVFALAAAMSLFAASVYGDQLESPGQTQSPEPAKAQTQVEPERTGSPQAATEPAVTPPEATQAKAGSEVSESDDRGVAGDRASSNEKSAVAEKASSSEVQAFIAALAAAERANENLTARLAQMEATATLQRERDQAFIRDMIRGVLWLAGGMAVVGMLALVAIVYLQLRSAKQQAITFAAQLQAITAHAALPGPGAVHSAALSVSHNQFEETATKIEEKLSDLESLAGGLPVSEAGLHQDNVPSGAVRAKTVSVGQPVGVAPRSASQPRGERLPDLLSQANSLLVQQQPEVALAYIDQALKQEPRNAEAQIKRGAALERLNRLTEALAAYDRAIESEPTLSVAYLSKAGVLNKLQRYSEALKCYESALAHQGGSASESSAA